MALRTADDRSTGPGARRPQANRAAYAAAVLASASAAVTLYWTAGGTALLDTVGGSVEETARDRDAAALALGLVTFAAKGAGAVLALVLARVTPRRSPPRRAVEVTAKVAAAVLVVWGAAGMVGAALGLAGSAGGDVDRTALWGHLLLWDPWFVLWGAALWRATGRPRSRPTAT